MVERWDGLAVVSRHDRETGTWIFIALHDDTLGACVGGTRLKTYARPAEALEDAMRLARGMTHKWAALEFDSGGGKGVLAVPESLDASGRRRVLLVYGRLIDRMNGAFSTGRDLGTTDADMRVLAEVTRHVHGIDLRTGTSRDPGPYTARGVLAAMRATLQAVHGTDVLAGRTVVVQGVGDVGEPLARRLAEEGATLVLADLDAERAGRLAGEIGASTVSTDAVYDVECDVYAPCAVGATLHRETIPRLRCRAVAGSANNQLAEDADADRLHERGILYAPDFVANGGGALAFGLFHKGVTDEKQIGARIDGIAVSLGEVYGQAATRGESPLHAAHRRVRQVLESRRN